MKLNRWVQGILLLIAFNMLFNLITNKPIFHKMIPFNAIAVFIGGFIAWKISKSKEKKEDDNEGK